MEGITLLKGIEVAILDDGELDLPDCVLAGLDVVVAAMHGGFGLPTCCAWASDRPAAAGWRATTSSTRVRSRSCARCCGMCVSGLFGIFFAARCHMAASDCPAPYKIRGVQVLHAIQRLNPRAAHRVRSS